MATVNGGFVAYKILGGPLRQIVFSGTVKLSAVGVVRDIIGYNAAFPTVVHETASDSSGNWTLTMPGGSNDLFRIIAVGINGENSEIYDRLVG